MIEIRANVERALRRGAHRRRAGAGRPAARASSTAAAASCSTRARERQAELDAGGTLDFVRGARRTSRSRPSPTRCRTGASRSPARPRARWSSTRSTRARAGSWRTSRTRTRPTGPTWSAARSTSPTPRAARWSTRRAARTTGSSEDHAVLLVRPRGLHLPERHLQVNGDDGGRRVHGLRAVRAPQRARRCSSAAPGPYFYIPKLESAARGGALARRLPDRRARARPRPRHDQGDRADRDGARPRSRWTRSCTSCATTPPG